MSLIFEEHKNVWVYQKCFQSTIVMAELQNASKIMFEIIIKEEKSEDRKQKIVQEVEKMFTGMLPSLDSKSREIFNSKFTSLKSLLLEMINIP